MRLLHVTNIISPHQMPLANCLAELVGSENFRYVATKPPMADRSAMGWDMEENKPWIIQAWRGEKERLEFEKWWNEADVVLCGERLIEKMRNRARAGKLTFYMSERWWKPPLGMARLLHPRFAWMAIRFRLLARSSYFHYLPMGYYAEYDMKRIVSLEDRMWRWGYFTALPGSQPVIAERSGAFRVLYAGRMLSWKKVDTLIKAFAIVVKQHGEVAQLTLIGDGPSKAALKELIGTLGISNNVEIKSSMPMEEVGQRMKKTDVYVLPSNGYEGWGAVVNEAMSQGCALVASDAVGSAKSLISHGENGLLFPSGNWRQLGKLLCQLCEDDAMRTRLALAGQQTIWRSWSPSVAAERFLAVSEALLTRRAVPNYREGPMVKVS